MSMSLFRRKNPDLFPENKRPRVPAFEEGLSPEGLGLALQYIEEKDREIRAALAAKSGELTTARPGQKNTEEKKSRPLEERTRSAERKTAGSARLDLRLLLAAAISAAGILASTEVIRPRQQTEQTDPAAERERAVLAFVRAAAKHVAMLDDERGLTSIDPENIEAAVRATINGASGPMRVTEKFGRSDYLVDFEASGIRNPLEHLSEVSKFPPRPPTPNDLERAARLIREAQSAARTLSFSFVDATGVWEVNSNEKPPANAPDWATLEQSRRRIIGSFGQELNLDLIDTFCADAEDQTGLSIRYRSFQGPDRSLI